MSEPTEYKLTTIKDIFDKIPMDKIELCLDELKIALLQARVIKAAADTIGERFEYPGEITWVDDEKGEITSNFVNIETQDKVGSFTVAIKK